MATKSTEVLCGGYSCTFVEDLPKELQTECAICLHTVKEPYLVDCCGYRFCKTCLDPLVTTRRCPLCNGCFTTIVPDKLLQRTLNEKLVYCTYMSEGCEWIGELIKLSGHVAGNCPGKPVLCKLCKEFKASRRELMEHQMSSCPSRLVLCPNGCGGSIKFVNVKSHMETKCPESAVCCEFAFAGCLRMVRRKDLKSHLEASKEEHLLFLTLKFKEKETESLSEAKKFKSEMAIKDNQIKQLKSKLGNLKSECTAKDNKIKQLKSEIHELKHGGDVAEQQSGPTETNCIMVSNFPAGTDQHKIKSHFGTFGRIKSIKWHADNGTAILEYVLASSVSKVLQKDCTVKGVVLRGTKLNISCRASTA